MSEITSFLCGMAFMAALSALWLWREWSNRRSVERRVEQLYEHLSCGGGILGCNGGPNCHWDHK
jgi:hypothetical protein